MSLVGSLPVHLQGFCGWSRGKFNIMPIYQNNNYMLLQIKERNFIDKFKPKLNKTWTAHTHKWK